MRFWFISENGVEQSQRGAQVDIAVVTAVSEISSLLRTLTSLSFLNVELSLRMVWPAASQVLSGPIRG